MKQILLLSFLVFSCQIYAFDCKKDKICNKIFNLMNIKDKNDAEMYTSLFKKYSLKYGIDPKISIAIAKQESNLNHKTHRKTNVIIYESKCYAKSDDDIKCIETAKIVNATTDVGYFQIHVNTIKNYELDPLRLKNDIEYMFDSHFRILKDKILVCKGKRNPWSCYHSFSPKPRKIYEQLALRHF